MSGFSWKTLAVVVAISGVASIASAGTIDLTATDPGGTVVQGTLTTDGSNNVTGFTGTVFAGFFDPHTGTISFTKNPTAGAISTSPQGAFFYDDIYSPGSDPVFDNDGLLFDVGGVEFNLFSNGPSNYVLYDYVDGGYNAEAVSLAVAAVPEPATWAMMLVGFFGLGALLRTARRKESRAVSMA